MEQIAILVNRLDKIGIKTKLSGNYPWVCITEINDRKIREKFASDHGFVVAIGNHIYLKEFFQLIRKNIK